MNGTLRLLARITIIVLVSTTWLAACAPSPTPPLPTVTPPATPVPAPTETPLAQAWTPGRLEIHVVAVDHGDAQLIVSPSGETMLVDGARAEFSSHVGRYLRQVLGEATVDYLLVTHYHVDHIQGIVPLFRDEGLAVRRAVLDRGGDREEYDSDHYRAYYDYLTDPAHGLERVRLRVGDQIDMGPQVTVDVLAVGDVDTGTSLGVPAIDDNDKCIALWLTFGELDYWTAGDLTGVNSVRYADIETAVIPFLPREADVYRANHHAIEYNSNDAFLAALDPTVIVASTYHAVATWDTVQRLEQQGDLYITGRVPAHEAYSDIVLASDDGSSYVVEGIVYPSK